MSISIVIEECLPELRSNKILLISSRRKEIHERTRGSGEKENIKLVHRN